MNKHKTINQYYDIPTISLRNSYLPVALSNKEEVVNMFVPDKAVQGTMPGVDLRHVRICHFYLMCYYDVVHRQAGDGAPGRQHR